MDTREKVVQKHFDFIKKNNRLFVKFMLKLEDTVKRGVFKNG